ncbi:MAG: hypothetical protein VX589_12425 [Myxococcota bacterium]|nr:hypothetical protein [Myxococcota bacterium]
MVLLLLSASNGLTPLQEAIECYEDLDYPCAETKLMHALEQAQTETIRLQALYYQALIAAAWRDDARIERLVRNIYAVQPDYAPKDPPPNLRRVFDTLRPKPAVAPIWGGRFDYRYTMLVDHDHDAGWWLNGSGLSAGASVILNRRYQIELDVNWSEHQPQLDRFSVDGLQLVGVGGGGGVTVDIKRVWLTAGLMAGAMRVKRSIPGAYRNLKESSNQSPFWVTSLALYLDVSVELVYGLSLGVRWSPTTLIRVYDDQPTVSYLLPLMVGVRYGR